MRTTISRKPYLKSILIFALVLVCFVLTVAVLEGDIYADDKGTGWLNSDSTNNSSFGGHEGYTRVISTLLVVIALIIATVYVLKKKYGVSTSISRNKKLIQIIDHVPMGVKKSVSLVRVPGKHLLLGLTNDRIELITEIANGDMTDVGESVNKKEFLNLIKKSISERKQR